MDNELPRFIYLAILGLALSGWVFAEYRKNLGKGVRAALAWVLIFFGFVAGYGLWEDVQSDVTRRHAVLQDGQSIEIPRGPDGHFHVQVMLNDTPVWFLVDTGATDIVLTKEDAERIGLEPEKLAFIGRANTANGSVKTAFARVDTVSLGPHKFRDLEVSVNGGQMNGSLLGMTFVNQFERLEISGNRLLLVP